MTKIPENLTGKKLFAWLIQNKNLLIASKKFEIKKADGVSYCKAIVNHKGEAVKAAAGNEVEPEDATKIERSLVINTTFWMDSHKDVHIDGLWKKSLSETKDLYLLQEHEMSFKGIISDEIDAYTQLISWKALGVDFPGTTQALIFDAAIEKERNSFMFDQYRKGYVKNHSVGMRYVDIQLAINDEDYKEEFAIWNKYISKIANKADAEASGYFFPVREAKVIEGSAVPIGSNRITPVRSSKQLTEDSPEGSTDQRPNKRSLYKQLKNVNLFTND